MYPSFNYGVDCRSKAGYDLRFQRFRKATKHWYGITMNSHSSIRDLFKLSKNIGKIYPLGLYSDNNFLKYLEFQIKDINQEYYHFSLIQSILFEKDENETNVGTSHRVNGIYSGLLLQVLVPTHGFPADEIAMFELLTSTLNKRNSQFNKSQYKSKCRVKINLKDEREMTLEEVFKFKDEYLQGKHEGYDTVVGFNYTTCCMSALTNYIKNESQLAELMHYLFSYYRTIEIKLELDGLDLEHYYTPTFSLFTCKQTYLKYAIYKYKNMDKNNYFEAYAVMKDLFLIIFNLLEGNEYFDPLILEQLDIKRYDLSSLVEKNPF